MASISANKVALIHYILRADDGSTIDSSRDSDPMPYMHGSGSLVPGLEAELEGKTVGDLIKVVVAPEDAYGPKSGTPPQPVPLAAFDGNVPDKGMPVATQDEEGNHIQLWVADVDDEQVFVTPDHPLAGMTLHFDVQIMEIRDATPAELEHGHAHPGDGHEH